MSMILERLARLDVAPSAVIAWRRGVGLAATLKATLLVGPLAGLGEMRPRLATVPLSADLWFVPLVLLAAGGLCLVADRAVRGGGIAVAIGGLLALSADARLYSNHLWLLALLAALAALTAPRARVQAEALPFGHLVLLQVSVVYGFAALSKLNAGFISGGVLWSELSGEGALLPMPDPVLTQQPMMALALATVSIELALAVGLWTRRARSGAAVLGIAFHFGLIAMVPGWEELLVFALLCWSTYPLFLARGTRTDSRSLEAVVSAVPRHRN
jgi:hypothetical protein